MKYLILLIALINILIFTRRHLSRRLRRTHGKVYKLKITVLDPKFKIDNNIIYEGEMEVEPTDNREIQLLVKIIQGQNTDDSANETKVEGTNIAKQKLPFFQRALEGYILIVNRALCRGMICRLRYGTDYVVAFFHFFSGDSNDLLATDLITTIRTGYMDLLKHELTIENQKLDLNIHELLITNNSIEREDSRIKKKDLAIMAAITKGTNYNIDNLYYQRDQMRLLLANELLYDFNIENEIEGLKQSIGILVGKYEESLNSFNQSNKTFESLTNFHDELGEVMFKDILDHLGISKKQYEFYDVIVSELFYSYLEKKYTQVFVEVIKNKTNELNLKRLVRKQMLNIRSYDFLTNYPSKLKPNPSIQYLYSALFESLNEKYMMFLLNQFRNEEVKFYKIMSLIESHMWVYRGNQFVDVDDD
jgi:hypothetical protein